jgi:hypothetical protein
LLLDAGELLVGDACLILLRLLLEHDIGFIACDVVEPDNSIDDAISGVHRTVLVQRRIRLRLRRDSGTVRTLVEPSLRTVTAQSGALVLPSGAVGRAMIAHLAGIETQEPVVALCASPADAIDAQVEVVEAAVGVSGLRHAIDTAFARACETQRPVVAVFSSDALAVRGTHRCRMSARDVQEIVVQPTSPMRTDDQIELPRVEIPAGVVVPMRSERMRRPIPAQVASVLELAQAEIGLPSRLHPAFPTFRTRTGALFTVVDVNRFAAMGVQCAAPEARSALFVIHGNGAAIARMPEVAAGYGLELQLANMHRPIDAARAIARTCLEAPLMPKAILLAEVASQVTVTGEAGVDPVFGGFDRTTASWMGEDSVVPVPVGGDMSRSVQLMPRTRDIAAAHAESLSALVPGWYEVRTLQKATRIRRLRANVVRRFTALVGVAS